MTRSRSRCRSGRLCRAASISSDLLRVLVTLVALAFGRTDPVPPGRATNKAAAPGGSPLIPRTVVPRTVPDGEGLVASSRGKATSATASVASEDFLTFCVDLDGLPEGLASSRDYRVVAVTGCQCSGKSTLLNALFGTG